MEKKSCLLTTYVAGINYQAFIPIFVFFAKKAYPEYDIMLFLHETLDFEIEKVLKENNLYEDVIFRENIFSDGYSMLSRKAGSCRWLLWDDCFYDYDYLYVVDIDMLYIREPKPLHVQHVERMFYTGLPFDNLRRICVYDFSLRGLAQKLKYSGWKGVKSYIRNIKKPISMLSGLHFIDVRKFYTSKNLEILENYRNRLNDKYYFPELPIPNEEVLLFEIITSMGYDSGVLGCQTCDSDNLLMLPFEDTKRKMFRPHHGIHLGIFKKQYYSEWNESTKKILKPILDSNTYRYYVEKYSEIYHSDEFQEILAIMPSRVREYIFRLNDYYNIN